MINKLFLSGDILSALCKGAKRWGMFININCGPDNIWMNEITTAAPFLCFEKDAQLISEGEGYILCDTEEEMVTLFYSCVGDDGPTRLNCYNGKVRVYALTCSPDGVLLNENT